MVAGERATLQGKIDVNERWRAASPVRISCSQFWGHWSVMTPGFGGGHLGQVPVHLLRVISMSRCLFLFNRSSKNSFITPATGRMVDICARGGTSMVTPRFDSRFVNRENKHISLLSLIQPAFLHLCNNFSGSLELK